MKAKKLVAVGMTVLMLGGLFVGCGNSADTSTGANSGKNVKITIFQSKIEANEGYKKLIAAYEKDHPNVEINLEAVTGNDFGASMKAKMQSDPPTIFSVGGFSDMKDYGDVIEDVSDLDIMQHALEGTTDTFTKDGKVYAIPLYMEGYGFVINKQMFEDAGVSVDSMMNFEGMKAGFDTLKKKIDNGEMKDKYPNLEAVMEYPTKELWIAGDHDANVALTHDFKTPNEAYAADSLPGTGFEDYKKMVDFQASYTTNANNTATRYNYIVKEHENGERQVSYDLTGENSLTLDEDLAGLDRAYNKRLANLAGYIVCQQTNDGSKFFQTTNVKKNTAEQKEYIDTAVSMMEKAQKRFLEMREEPKYTAGIAKSVIWDIMSSDKNFMETTQRLFAKTIYHNT